MDTEQNHSNMYQHKTKTNKKQTKTLESENKPH